MAKRNNKAILLINLMGNFDGGAQKRYSALYNKLVEQGEGEYYLIINDILFENLYKNSILRTKKNVLILKFPSIVKTAKAKASGSGESTITVSQKKKNPIKGLLGSFKTFIKMVYLWIIFSFQLRKLILKNKIGLVYSVYTGGMWAWPLKNIFNFYLIHSFNNSAFNTVHKKTLKFFDSEYWVLKHADKIDFLSTGLIKETEKIIGTIDKKRIVVTPNSFITYDNYFARLPKDNTVVFLARMNSTKNPLLFLESLLVLSKRFPEFSGIDFYLIGDGTERNNIKNFIKKHRFKNVHFLGSISKPWEYLQKSKIFISIQQKENYPSQSLLEAMACENAIIASDVGETRLLVTEDEGVLVKLDADAIADAIIKLITTPELMESLGKKGRIKATSNHTIDKFAEYFIDITS
jgi:glycosyltransferase involved in cell wall biosynthesis